jgi:hypothetical protein
MERNGGPQDEEEGVSIEEMADEGFEPEDTTPMIEGTSGQLSLSVGGRKPDSAAFKMKSAEVKLRDKSQFTKGETVELTVIARIDDVTFRDMHDEYGTVTATKRIHTAKPINVDRVADSHTRLEAALLAFVEDADQQDASVESQIDDLVKGVLSTLATA